jgi:ubiquinone/menaquinone biosynthesis C-methylase UbiE
MDPGRGRRLLDVGCGGGTRMVPFVERGVDVTGIDPSPYMLDLGKAKLRHKMEFFKGFGEELPFEDNAFHYVTIITSLEYAEDPKKVIQEAARVAKNKIFIGITNRYAFNCAKLRVKGLISDTVHNRARFYSIWQLTHMVKTILGNVPVTYKTTSRLHGSLGTYCDHMNISGIIQKLPFGAFAGILITPVPRFITTPLVLKYKAEKAIPSRVQPMKGSESGEA